MHELVQLLDIAHASIIAHADEAVLRSEIWAQHESHEGREAHPDPALVTALATKRHALGDRWVRPPRWGTYLDAAQLSAAGGRERIIETVQPAVIREVGALVYVQLSAHPHDALAPETLAKQRTFESVLAPIVVPS